MRETIDGQLEIDHERGVIYFHVNSLENAERFGVVTILRICRLPEIPENTQLDITHMFGCSW